MSVDVQEHRFTVREGPSPAGYRVHRRFERGERVTSRQFPPLTVAVSELV